MGRRRGRPAACLPVADTEGQLGGQPAGRLSPTLAADTGLDEAATAPGPQARPRPGGHGGGVPHRRLCALGPRAHEGAPGTSVSMLGPAGASELEGLREGLVGASAWQQRWLTHLSNTCWLVSWPEKLEKK